MCWAGASGDAQVARRSSPSVDPAWVLKQLRGYCPANRWQTARLSSGSSPPPGSLPELQAVPGQIPPLAYERARVINRHDNAYTERIANQKFPEILNNFLNTLRAITKSILNVTFQKRTQKFTIDEHEWMLVNCFGGGI